MDTAGAKGRFGTEDFYLTMVADLVMTTLRGDITLDDLIFGLTRLDFPFADAMAHAIEAYLAEGRTDEIEAYLTRFLANFARDYGDRVEPQPVPRYRVAPSILGRHRAVPKPAA